MYQNSKNCLCHNNIFCIQFFLGSNRISPTLQGILSQPFRPMTPSPTVFQLKKISLLKFNANKSIIYPRMTNGMPESCHGNRVEKICFYVSINKIYISKRTASLPPTRHQDHHHITGNSVWSSQSIGYLIWNLCLIYFFFPLECLIIHHFHQLTLLIH